MVTTHYFLASEEELSAACRGWRVPLATPRKRRDVNPFTGEPILVQDYDPQPGVPFGDAAAAADLSGLKHVELSGIDVVRLTTLMQLMIPGADWTQCYRPARLGPPEAQSAVCAVPAELVSAVATTLEAQVPDLNARWVAALRQEAQSAGIAEAREELLAELDEGACLAVLERLHALARQAVLSGRAMYCAMEL